MFFKGNHDADWKYIFKRHLLVILMRYKLSELYSTDINWLKFLNVVLFSEAAYILGFCIKSHHHFQIILNIFPVSWMKLEHFISLLVPIRFCSRTEISNFTRKTSFQNKKCISLMATSSAIVSANILSSRNQNSVYFKNLVFSETF